MDAEDCLMCHRFRGLARVDKEGTYRLFHVDETLFNRGPHARVSCRVRAAKPDRMEQGSRERSYPRRGRPSGQFL